MRSCKKGGDKGYKYCPLHDKFIQGQYIQSDVGEKGGVDRLNHRDETKKSKSSKCVHYATSLNRDGEELKKKEFFGLV